jgi:hypothetical protein
MRIFSKRSGPLVHARSGGELFLRSVCLIAVFALAAWLFWKNTQANIDRILAQSTVQDQANGLSVAQRAAVRDFAKLLKEEFGYELKVVIGPAAATPVRDAKTVFLGLEPDAKRATVLLPPLAGKGLGPQFVASLGDAHFAPYFERGEWPEGLLRCLERLWYGLKDANAGAAGANP